MNDKLINKDIEKVCVIVDTDDITHTGSTQTRSNFEYKIRFDENGFGGVFNNVIGFRLKKAILRNNPILIDSSNSTIQLVANNDIYRLKPTLYGHYTGSSLKTLFNGDTNWAVNNTGYNTSLNGSTNHDFDSTTNKFNFGAPVTFDFSTYKASARLLGFNPGDSSAATTGHISPFPIDLSNHYVDVVVPEVPSIACKRTATGKNVVERIPMTASAGATQYFICDPTDLQSSNYFYPMKLSEITIQLYSDNNNLLSATNEHSSFEFEITMLKNNTFR